MLEAWLLAAMLQWQPVTNPDDRERYGWIAHDVALVARTSTPVFVDDPKGARLAILLLSIAFWESRFRRDVEEGRTRGDSGHSWCLMQVKVHGRTPEGWTGIELAQDHRKCLRSAVAAIRESFQICRTYAPPDRLGGYVRGYCKHDDPVARLRFRWAELYWQKHHAELETMRDREHFAGGQ